MTTEVLTSSYTCTWGDMEAQSLLSRAGELPCSSVNVPSPTDCGNRIIELAERIKAQRAVIAMQR